MSRMQVVRRPEDCAGPRTEVDELFNLLFPAGAERVLSGAQVGWGLVAAHGPATATALAKLTKAVAGGAFLAARPDLREIAVQFVNLHFQCEFSHRSHLAYLAKVGLTLETIAALPYWRSSTQLDPEQKLVIEYSHAVLTSTVSDALHERVAAKFGQPAVTELALAVGVWSLWALFLNAAQPANV